MRGTSIILATLLVWCVFGQQRTYEDDVKLFQDYKQTYGRTYAAEESAARLECFRQNLRKIDERNARGKERHGVNQFTDICADEFRSTHFGYVRRGLPTQRHVASPRLLDSSSTSPPGPAPANSSIDWRQRGAVTPIKNQNKCGGCWSFSPTGNVEGQWFLSGQTLVGLSEQELISCDKTDNACNGGNMGDAFQWIINNGGIDSEEDYPFVSGNGKVPKCQSSKSYVATLSDWTQVTQDEATIAQYVYANGPVSIGVDAETWSSYAGGIMSDCDGDSLDHAVLIVGFNTAASTPYWIVKNQWGTSWGENGYIRLEYGTNQCGLSEDPSSSIVS